MEETHAGGVPGGKPLLRGVLHEVGAFVALAAGTILVLRAGSARARIAAAIYGISLVALLAASAVYHRGRWTERARAVLRRVDHSAIFVLIAGTYTPICLHFFAGFWRWGVLAIIWSMAIVGIVVKVFVIRAPRWLTAAIYLAMGWLCLMGIRVMLATMPMSALLWLLLGGIFFSVGAIVYVTKRPDFYPGVFGFHELWHIFVILGCLSHFILMAAYVA